MKYLFRGKAVDGGEWVEGSFQEGGLGRYMIHPECHWPRFVIPATVGMFTGLKDRRGCRIFEGDILKGQINPGTIEHGPVEWHIFFAGWIWGKYPLHQVIHEAAVVGTVHDEPEGGA